MTEEISSLEPPKQSAFENLSQTEGGATSSEERIEGALGKAFPEEWAEKSEAEERRGAEVLKVKRQKVEAQQKSEESFTQAAFEELMAAAQEAAWSSEGSKATLGDGLSQCETLPYEVRGAGRTEGSEDSQNFLSRIRAVLAPVFCSSTRALQVREVCKAICDVMLISQDELHLCGPQPMAGKMDLYPLPAADITDDPEDPFFSLRALTFGLNSLAGLGVAYRGAANPTATRVLKRLRGIVESSCILDEPLPNIDFKEFFNTRSVDYAGDEIKLAKELTWESIEPSLPGEVGQLHLRDFCEAGVLHYIDNFESFLVPQDELSLGKVPKVMVRDEHWLELARGLLDRGLCEIFKEEDLFRINGVPILNGLFAVSKQEMRGPIEVCRLIMNLKPLNQNCRPLAGDTATLPTATCLSNMFLDQDEVLLTSSEDIKCFFYLFQVPRSWRRFMGFGKPLPRDLVGDSFGDSKCFLVSRVLPMGWLNSVAIAQHIHRNVVRNCLGCLSPPVGGEAELRRDRLFSTCPKLFRVYLDNFDELVRVNRETASLVAGTPTPEVERLRESYTEQGLPRHPKKAAEQEPMAEVQGAWVDGQQGIICAKPVKIAKYVALTLKMLIEGTASQRELQVVGGGLVYISMFRRPILCGLNQLWRAIVELEAKPDGFRAPIKREVVHELSRFLGILPLAFSSLRAPPSGLVTCSDASTTGGGVCMSKGMTPYGCAAALSSVRGDLPEEHDFVQVLSIGLFDGISGLRVALDALGLPMAGHISVESSDEARRVVESYFPDTIFISDVNAVTDEMVKEWSLRFSGAGIVLVGAGPPCQGVSGLNADRRGALRDHRSSLFHHVPRITAACRQHFPWAQVHNITENVASMDYEDCLAMNEGYQDEPWYIDAAGASLARRPRLYWVTWELFPDEDARVLWGSNGRLPIKGEVVLNVQAEEKRFLQPGWHMPDQPLPTFTTSRPSSTPHRRPAGLQACQPHERERWKNDAHRFPPYQYRDCNCLQNSMGDFRPPNIAEREAILGFPLGYTKQCMKKSSHGSVSHQDCRLTLLGNSWSVPVITWLVASLFHCLGLIAYRPLKQIVKELTPGQASELQGLLIRPPVHGGTLTHDSNELLVKKICGLTSLKGEDILLQHHSDFPVKYHRLRMSLPAKLWRWRTVSGWTWRDQGEHINVLELRATFTAIKWRVERLQQMDIRCLHLVDSLVVLHSLTRGRSSSRKMRRTLMRVNSYVLACGLYPRWAYIDTHQNPADRPSRRGVRKKWVKRV